MKKQYKKISFIALIGAFGFSAFAQDAEIVKLTGNVIGTELSVDYATDKQSTTVNTKECAFDGDSETFFASFNPSFTWVGLELDQQYIITKVGFMARDDSYGPKRVQLAVFEGANNPDFSDAMPIYLVPEKGVKKQMVYADVDCSKGFKYVRYVGPRESNCNIAELEFYGYPGEGDDSHLYQPTNLPLVVVNTPNMEWFHSNNKDYEMEGSQVYVIKDSEFDINATAQIRGRGNSSWNFPKKPFRIKFDKKQTVLGGPAHAKKWTMISNYSDKTLMRNMLAFEMSRRIGMAYTPVCHPVDLIFNGEYQGTYQLCDQVEIDENRVNITKMSPEDTEGEALTGGYLIEIDGYANKEDPDEWFKSTGGHAIWVSIKSPDGGVPEQFKYIQDYFSALEKAVYMGDYGSEEYGYKHYLDEESFLRHFIVGELSGDTDTYWSVYMSLDRGSEKFFTGPCWDFDLGFDNDCRTYPVNERNEFVCIAKGSFVSGMKDFVKRIVKTEKGSKRLLSEIWSEARLNRGFNADEFDQLITEYAQLMDQSQKLNFKCWDILDKAVHENPKAWGSYEAEVQVVRDFLSKRFEKLDQIIGLVDVSAINDMHTDDTTVSADRGGITLVGNKPYQVLNLQGVVVASGSGNADISLPAGIYIVNAEGSNPVKVCVNR